MPVRGRDLTCDQLTMGDYQRILENPDCWTRLGWSPDRKSDPLPDGAVSMPQNFIKGFEATLC